MTSVNPTLIVGEIIAEPIKIINPSISHRSIENTYFAFLDKVELPKSCYTRYIWTFW